MLLIIAHCGMRHADFLLERAIVNRRRCDPAALTEAAIDLLRLALKAYGARDYLREYQIDILDLVRMLLILVLL